MSRPVHRRWWFWVAVVVVVLAVGGALGGGDDPADAVAAQTTQAEEWQAKVIDDMTADEVLRLMPSDVPPGVHASANLKTYSWTFGDGSTLYAEYCPIGDGEEWVLCDTRIAR